MNKQCTFVIDLDGTLCSQESTGTYYKAKPIKEMIDKVNTLYDAGYKIVIFTARGMDTCKGDVERVLWNYTKITKDWLEANGVKYHELMFGKPSATFHVDDKAMTLDRFLAFIP